MRYVIALPLLACATPRPQWTAAIRASVSIQCELFATERYCQCLVPALEQASPDPEADFTRAEVTAAVKHCGPIEKAEKGEEL